MFLLKQFKNYSLQCFLWFITIVIAAIPLVWLGLTHHNYLHHLNNIIAQNKLLFTFLRWLAIIAIFAFWSRFIRWWAKRHYWKPEKTMFWLKQRLEIMLWLGVFELLVCENLLTTLIRLFESS